MLIVLGGLPGVGKSSVARGLGRAIGATWLRIDTIEAALGGLHHTVTIEGYVVAYRVALDNLRMGQSVIADSVNPIELTRNAWRDVARDASAPCVEVEITCSDAQEHRRRVETRTTDIPGWRVPDWQAVSGREFEPWTRPRIVIDTAHRSIEACVTELRTKLPQEN